MDGEVLVYPKTTKCPNYKAYFSHEYIDNYLHNNIINLSVNY